MREFSELRHIKHYPNSGYCVSVPEDIQIELRLKHDCKLFWDIDYRSGVATLANSPGDKYHVYTEDRVAFFDKSTGVAEVPKVVASRLRWRAGVKLEWLLSSDGNMVLKKVKKEEQ